jgi:hypothetical protein
MEKDIDRATEQSGAEQSQVAEVRQILASQAEQTQTILAALNEIAASLRTRK